MEEVYNKEQFYCDLIHDRLLSFYYEKPLNTSHLKPIEDILFNGKDIVFGSFVASPDMESNVWFV